ncbi:hypothetical protein A3Q56_03130 [Intoshia linei]|uniref:Signal peptidase complex subunit 3 n=1 Tax=Intoshia linei TaxID=1819745 RepID=A0A177B5Z4_9BILA|nr:hypothetical protein A3Q56_03130 [Intoshia linei]
METFSTRVNYLMSVFIYTTAVFAIMIAFHSYTKPTDVEVSIKVKNALTKAVDSYKSVTYDLATVKANIQANFTNIFDWNVRQVFIFMVLTYETKDKKVESTIWDFIMLRENNQFIDLKNEKSKYTVVERHNLINNNKAKSKLSLRWNIIPNTGLFLWNRAPDSGEFTFIPRY